MGIPLAILSWFGTPDHDDRETSALLGMLGWGIVGASVVPELAIDILALRGDRRRPFPHGRYCDGRQGCDIMLWNMLQTSVFSAAVVFKGLFAKRTWDNNIVVYDDDFYYSGGRSVPTSTEDLQNRQEPSFFYSEKDYRMDWMMLWRISSLLFMLSGLIAALMGGCCCCPCQGEESRPSTATDSIKWSRAGNCMYLTCSILGFLGSFEGTCNQCFFGYVMDFLWHGGFLVAGFLWVVGDVMALKEPVVEDCHEENMRSSSPVPSCTEEEEQQA